MVKNTSNLIVHISSQQFSFELPGKIWKIVSATNDSKLVAEVREESEMVVSYYLIDLEKHETHGFNPKEVDWWSSILIYRAPYLLLENFLDPQNPLNKQLIVYHIYKKENMKVIDNFQFQSWDTDLIRGHTSGKPHELHEITLNPNINKTSQFNFPLQFDRGSSSHHMVADFLETEPEKLPSVEYLEYQDHIIICYYVRLGTKFARKLLILKGDSELCHLVIDEEMSGFAAGSFFVQDQTLIYVEKSRFLNGIILN